MKINILRLKNAPGQKMSFTFLEPINDIEMDGQKFTFTESVKVTGEVVNQINLFTIKGITEAKVSTICGSCLEPFEMNLRAELDETYTQEAKNDPDGELVEFHGDIIDIEPEVVKALLGEMPIRLICSPDCKGLCSKCGSNLNYNPCGCQHEVLDPRLAILKKLQQ